MSFTPGDRAALLRDLAPDYLNVALRSIVQVFPHMPWLVATAPGPYPLHRESHPAFYGSFDWHSCVEMHWVAIRLLRRFPDDLSDAQARATNDALITPEHIAAEISFFRDPAQRSFERPYGWGWLLRLARELQLWDDTDGRRWAATLEPLADIIVANLIAWLPKLTYPQRTGMHQNTAFGLSSALTYAEWLADRGQSELRHTIAAAANRLFAADLDYPAHYEPSGADFLSPALCEGELMSHLLPAGEFPTWLNGFLPGLAEETPASLFQPAIVSDPTDGQIAHLHGLNLSRAWAFVSLADRLPAGDSRIATMTAAAERHAAASLPFATGSDYMVEHWLAAYATLLLSEGVDA